MSTVPVRWLKLAWALAAFMPLVTILTPVLAPRIGIVFIVCALYLMPASWLAQRLGVEPLTTAYNSLGAVYCAAVGALAAALATRVLRLPPRITRARAMTLIAAVWLPLAIFVAYRVMQYGGLFTRPIACPGHLYILEPHCASVSELMEQELEAFIDASYVASFRLDPSALQTIVATNAMKAIDPRQVPDSMWSQPPVWWKPLRSASTQVYMTPGFSFENRGGDGEHYLLIDDRAAGKVYVFLQSNF